MTEEAGFSYPPATVYWVETDEAGRVYMHGMCQPNVAHRYAPLVAGRELLWLMDAPSFDRDLEFYHVEDGFPVSRPVLLLQVSKTEIAADDTDAAVISGIPPGATLLLDGVALDEFAGGSVTLTSSLPAVYQIRVECWPYLPSEVEVVAR